MTAATLTIEFTEIIEEGLTFVVKTVSFRLKPLAKKRLYIDALQKNLLNALHLISLNTLLPSTRNNNYKHDYTSRQNHS
jgi:hypothetical protein